MYEIWADDLLIHSDVTPLETAKVINPHLTLEDSAAGSLEMSLPPINVGYSQDILKRMVTNIVVRENGEFLWGGRILQDSFDFWNNRKILCEGELAFLNDSIQPPKKYDVTTDHTTIESFFYALIDIHNSQVGPDRQFEKGMVTVTDGDQTSDTNEIYRFTNYETTLECMNEKLLEKLKGHLRIRHQAGKRYLDYISDDTLDTNTQVVRFGINLLDFSKNIDMTELSTVIVPRGVRLDIDDSDPRYIEGLESYLTVVDVETKVIDNKTWHTQGEIFVQNPDAVDNFGRIATVVDWNNVTDKDVLYSKAEKYLKDEQYEKMTLEINALDLKYLTDGDEPIKFQSKLRCVSEPHGMDHTFIVSKMDIDLSNPGNSLYTLGTDVKLSLTQAASRVNSDVQAQIDRLPSKSEILIAAERNAYQMIMGSENSYVHFIPGIDPLTGKNKGIKRIEVTNGPTYDGDPDDEHPSRDPFPDSTHRWIWTVGGLGHIERDTYQDSWDGFNPETGQFDDLEHFVAMTMDGSIVADRIVTGKLKAYGNRYILDTETGQVTMEWAKLGPWLLNLNGAGLTDGHDAWIEPNKISCGQHGGLLVVMQGHSSGSHDGHLSVEVNDFDDWVRTYYDDIERKRGGSTQSVEWDTGSDEQLKEDIESLSLEEAMAIIKNTEALTFRYKEGDKTKHYGFTAQRVDAECDKLGIEKSFTHEFGHQDGFRTIKYTQFIAPMLKVIQEQQKQIEALQNK